MASISLSGWGGDLQAIAGSTLTMSLAELRINEGPKALGSREKLLRDLGASQVTFDQIERMVRLDRNLWKRFCES